MRVVSVSHSFAKRATSNIEIYSQLFQIQKSKPIQISADLYTINTSKNSILLTHSGDDFIVVDFMPLAKNQRMQVLKNGAIKSLIEAKKGKTVPFEKLLFGAIEKKP